MYDNEEAAKLTQMHERNLTLISKRLSSMGDMVNVQPYDPKIAAHLKMAADLASEQVALGKYYTYPKVAATVEKEKKESDYKFLEQDDTVEEHHDIKNPVSEPVLETPPPPPSTSIDDDDIHRWLDGISEG